MVERASMHTVVVYKVTLTDNSSQLFMSVVYCTPA